MHEIADVCSGRGVRLPDAQIFCVSACFSLPCVVCSADKSPRVPVIAFFSAKKPSKLPEMENHDSFAVIFEYISYLY